MLCEQGGTLYKPLGRKPLRVLRKMSWEALQKDQRKAPLVLQDLCARCLEGSLGEICAHDLFNGSLVKMSWQDLWVCARPLERIFFAKARRQKALCRISAQDV